MQVTVNLGTNARLSWLKPSRWMASSIRPILQALVEINRLYLKSHPEVPPLYKAGIRYQNEPRNHALLELAGTNVGRVEEFAAVPAVLARGWGDCDDLAPWRCAELRNAGENADIRITWRKLRNGRLYHIVVRRGNGSIEDPSRILGMGR